MLHLQMRFRPVVPLKQVLPVVEEGVAVVAERLLLPNPEQCHLELVLTSQRTSCLAEEALVPLIRHRHLLEVEADLEARLAAWVLGVAERTEQADLQLGIVSGQLALQRPNFASHLGPAHRSGAGSRTMRCDLGT